MLTISGSAAEEYAKSTDVLISGVNSAGNVVGDGKCTSDNKAGGGGQHDMEGILAAATAVSPPNTALIRTSIRERVNESLHRRYMRTNVKVSSEFHTTVECSSTR